jgi:hypothetical protein
LCAGFAAGLPPTLVPPHGRFDAPDADPEELRLRLEPAVAKLGSGG